MTAVSLALITAALLGVVCGLLGTFVVVRRMALTGDMLSHAVLPGVVIGLAWNPSRNPLLVLVCAVAAGLIGSVVMTAILRSTKLKADVALALVLSVFFAIGIAMISRIQPSGVLAFLYGQVAAIDQRDLLLLAAVSAATLVIVPLMFRVLGMVSFDPAFAKLLGLPVKWIETGFFLLLTVVIVIAMQAVGVVLVTAMLVTPAAAARFCTVSLGKMASLACAFGAIGGAIGVAISAYGNGLPTGPLMALSVTAVFLTAGVFGKRSGWLPMMVRRHRERHRILGEDVLKKLWMHEETTSLPAVLTEADFKQSLPGNIASAFRKLRAGSLIGTDHLRIALTESGRKRAAELVRSHRLWERYLTELAAYKPDHVHESAERIEHWLDDAARRRLEQRLGNPDVDPHGKPIPPP